jgi:uncharacterized protein YndB with AHSA1/START domain
MSSERRCLRLLKAMKGNPMAPAQIEREIVVNAPLERVWAVLTEPKHIAGWFGDRAEVDLRPGGAVAFHWKEHGTYFATVDRVEPQTFFSYRWAMNADEPPREGNSTLVEFTLRPEGHGTRLRVVETGFNTLDIPEAEQTRHAEMNTDGWREELAELQDYAQRQAA